MYLHFLHYTGKLHKNQLQYLLGECGIAITESEVNLSFLANFYTHYTNLIYRALKKIERLLATQQAHFQTTSLILQRNRAIRLFGYKQKSRVERCDNEHISRDGFVALLLSCWQPSKLLVSQIAVEFLEISSF